MTAQLTINFATQSRINAERLTGQNKRLYDWLSAGNTIHAMHPERQRLRIGYIPARIFDIIKFAHVEIFRRYINVLDVSSESVTVVEYSMKPFEG